MKYLLASILLFVAFSTALSAELPAGAAAMVEEYEGGMRLERINDDDYEDDNDNEFFILTFSTRIDTSKPNPEYMVRVTVQLFDKKTEKWIFAQEQQRVNVITSGGTGQTDLAFEIPYNEMRRPKMEACVIEFGINKGGEFIPVVADYDGVDSADEITGGKGRKVRMACTKNMPWFWDR